VSSPDLCNIFSYLQISSATSFKRLKYLQLPRSKVVSALESTATPLRTQHRRARLARCPCIGKHSTLRKGRREKTACSPGVLDPKRERLRANLTLFRVNARTKRQCEYVLFSSGEGQKTRRCRRVACPESYITKYTKINRGVHGSTRALPANVAKWRSALMGGAPPGAAARGWHGTDDERDSPRQWECRRQGIFVSPPRRRVRSGSRGELSRPRREWDGRVGHLGGAGAWHRCHGIPQARGPVEARPCVLLLRGGGRGSSVLSAEGKSRWGGGQAKRGVRVRAHGARRVERGA